MKMILCIFLFGITVCGCSGQSKELSALMNGKVIFPEGVKKTGMLLYEGDAIADVTDGQSKTDLQKRFTGRLEWNRGTGLFSISGLQKDDAGEYKVQVGGETKTYKLALYVPVSKPRVSVTRNEYPCTLLCAVDRGTEATLHWYREGEKKPYGSSSIRSAPYLDLPQTVERSGIYTCDAKNSVSNETASIVVGPHCTGGAAGSWQIEVSKMWQLSLVLIVMLYSLLV